MPPPLASKPSFCPNCAAAFSKSCTPMMIWSMAVSIGYSPCSSEHESNQGGGKPRPYPIRHFYTIHLFVYRVGAGLAPALVLALSPRAGEFACLAPAGCASGGCTFEV